MMKSPLPFPPKHRFLTLLRPEVQELGVSSNVAWKNLRLMGTATAREIAGPVGDGSKRKRVSKEERKAMVVEFVNKYRMMNAGKFPSAENTKKQVGGSYYSVRSILQELKYNSKLPNLAITNKTSMVEQANKVTQISEVREAVDSAVPPHLDNHHINSQSGISEIRKAPDNEVLSRTATVRSIPLETLNETSVPDKTTEVIGVSEAKDAFKSDVPLPAAMVTNDRRNPSEDGSNSENGFHKVKEVLDHEVSGMANGVNECRISAEEDSSSSVQVSESRFQRTIPTVATTNSNLLAAQTDTKDVREVIDTEVEIGTTAVSNEHGHPSENDFIEQGVVGSSSYRNMVDTSVLTKDNEMIVEDFSVSENLMDLKLQREQGKLSNDDVDAGDNDESLDITGVLVTRNLEKATVDQPVKATNIASGFPSKSDHPESLSSCRNTKLPKIDEASSPTSESQQFTSDTMQKTQETRSLWGNLKSIASSFMSIWRKS